VGYEINAEFFPVIREKLAVTQQNIDETTYEFLKQDTIQKDFEDEIKTLPYVFNDPINSIKKWILKNFNSVLK